LDLSRLTMDRRYGFGMIGGLETPPSVNSLLHCIPYFDIKRDTISIVSPPNVSFRRDLIGPRLTVWNALFQLLDSIQLSVRSDEFWWNLHDNGNFSVDFLYKTIIQSVIPFDNNKKIWKMKIPLKTKIFAWYLYRGVILTKDNLVKCNWHGSTRCVFLSSRWDNQTHIFPMALCQIGMVNHPSSFRPIPSN
jgi:hypothetical protein